MPNHSICVSMAIESVSNLINEIQDGISGNEFDFLATHAKGEIPICLPSMCRD